MTGHPNLPNIAYLGLGSNVGDRESNLLQAVRMLAERDEIAVVSVSKIYETDPVGYVEQPAFLNMACRIGTSLPPASLLQAVLDVERKLGRVRTVRWGPRTIDIDILLYNELKLDTPELTLPHPRLTERPFVLVPLRDVMPDMESRFPVKVDHNDGGNGVRVWTTTTFKPEEFGHSENSKDTPKAD
ncbi:2-amino-4-hydroxy-6-hydroxymethyldihydropteridine diphosphokinase [Paenibacillus alkalitolerans]|uniref:2-amino-4-hydroxy-6- hydroxymethyldihydropteridine diphosphokinase n=1 Tax=Paenibacillus alkalitolerans TaxID=2799335 RepID=UPI0018F2F524|nr:2-amino-4-hydroxy-6-hydroxymethyldihydropteridine diphosphokinase [Paenibacillus alkalitolerans]